MSNPAGAARYLRERGLDRIATLARQKLILYGRPAGRLVLPDAGSEEHAGIAALAGRRVGQDELRVSLSDLDAWLLRSRFACSLEDALAAYFGEPVPSRPLQKAEARAAVASAREEFRQALEALAESFPAASLARRWLAEGGHGVAWLVQRWGRLEVSAREERLALIRGVARALARLPLDEPRRLAVFADECLGNPHALDPTEEAGRLFVQALLDVAPDPDADAARLSPVPLLSEQGSWERPPSFRADGTSRESRVTAATLSTAERGRLYEVFGLLVDTLSPTVAAFNLREAIWTNGARETFPPGVLDVLPLRRLLAWRSLRAAGERVFVVENPVVFEEILDPLEPKVAAGEDVPTVLCTSGWPSAAGLRALDLIVRGDGEIQLAYSGDFDLAGLRIAASLSRRYPSAFRPWRLSADDYLAALRPTSPAASPSDLDALATLQPSFPDLISAIQSAGRWAYQEAIATRLIDDVAGSCPPQKAG